MKKTIPFLLALTALLGTLNCGLLEPALAYQLESTSASAGDEDADCCFICCSVHHQWITAQSYEFLSLDPLSDGFALIAARAALDPPSRSIFHPPSVF